MNSEYAKHELAVIIFSKDDVFTEDTGSFNYDDDEGEMDPASIVSDT